MFFTNAWRRALLKKSLLLPLPPGAVPALRPMAAEPCELRARPGAAARGRGGAEGSPALGAAEAGRSQPVAVAVAVPAAAPAAPLSPPCTCAGPPRRRWPLV